MARPTKYNETIEKLICDRLRIGATRKASAESSGISFETFRQWMERFPAFFASATRAEAEAELRYTSRLAAEVSAKDGDWRAAVEWLKRRRRDDWSEKVETDVKHSGNVTHEHIDADEEAIIVAADRIKERRRSLSPIS